MHVVIQIYNIFSIFTYGVIHVNFEWCRFIALALLGAVHKRKNIYKLFEQKYTPHISKKACTNTAHKYASVKLFIGHP